MARLKRAAALLPAVENVPAPPALKTYIVGIDSNCREYYRVEAASEEEAEKMLVQFAEGHRGDEGIALDGCSESELRPDSVGDAFEMEVDN